MENTCFVKYSYDACSQLAEHIFFRMSGIRGEGRKADRMRQAAMEVRQMIEPRIKVRGAYAFYHNVKLCGRQAEIGGRIITCNAFEQINESTVEGCYVYALSAGDYSFPDAPLMEQLYADIWGSAFADAARLLLVEQLKKGIRLSDSFGPGYYGMDMQMMTAVTKLIDMDALEIHVRENGILLPLKSCVALFFKVNDMYQPLQGACMNCHGNHISCQLCSIRGGK